KKPEDRFQKGTELVDTLKLAAGMDESSTRTVVVGPVDSTMRATPPPPMPPEAKSGGTPPAPKSDIGSTVATLTPPLPVLVEKPVPPPASPKLMWLAALGGFAVFALLAIGGFAIFGKGVSDQPTATPTSAPIVVVASPTAVPSATPQPSPTTAPT